MKYILTSAALVAMGTHVFALPQTCDTRDIKDTKDHAAAAGNPFSDYTMWANSFYAAEIAKSGAADKAKAAAVGKVPTFFWLDKDAVVPKMGDQLKEMKAAGDKNLGLFVVYNLPNRDCSALASNGELTVKDDGAAKYKKYIDSIAAQLTEHKDSKVALVIEPDSLANLVTNLDVAKCKEAETVYKDSVVYAVKTLGALPNVAGMYLDAGHGGWLGWTANLAPAAKLFTEIWTTAGKPANLRGLATNVANYNAFKIDTAPSYTTGNDNFDEQKYITAMAGALTTAGWTGAKFITDTGRNGAQPTKQLKWGDWCNLIGAGFGARPTAETGDPNVDAFVWVKPGGECDGTSDTAASRYDAHCGAEDALKPAPEAGAWFDAYFQQLLANANPPFA